MPDADALWLRLRRLIARPVGQAGGAAAAADRPRAQRVGSPLPQALLRRLVARLVPMLLLLLLAPLVALLLLRQLARQLSIDDGPGGVSVEVQGEELWAAGPAAGRASNGGLKP